MYSCKADVLLTGGWVAGVLEVLDSPERQRFQVSNYITAYTRVQFIYTGAMLWIIKIL